MLFCYSSVINFSHFHPALSAYKWSVASLFILFIHPASDNEQTTKYICEFKSRRFDIQLQFNN